MIESKVLNQLKSLEENISLIKVEKSIDCITIFPASSYEYILLNKECEKIGKVIDKMSSGDLYFLCNVINTQYGDLRFIKIRKYNQDYVKYGISVDFTVKDYIKYKSALVNPIIKEYDTFELIQYKTDNSIINVVSLSAKDDYKL